MDWTQRLLVTRTLAMPADTNPRGDIFGGWIVSLMDISVAAMSSRFARGLTATRAIRNVLFDRPIFVGDELSVYVKLAAVGTTSMTFEVDVTVQRSGLEEELPAVRGTFIMVALDENRRPRRIDCCDLPKSVPTKT
ncbi:MAG: acyl-CoA thioesterase [Holosporales bacterium]|jgi:acyl-CoA thioesterase YciA|nr:acyl-CoA thioesterase [Holosporales bacterium]